jgi:hypothetical protein
LQSNASSSWVAERLYYGPNRQNNDILNSLLEIVAKEGDKLDFGTQEVQVEIHIALSVFPYICVGLGSWLISCSFAGSDTTAEAISSVLYHLMKNPSAYLSLTAEIDEATQAGLLSVPNIRYSEARKLPYLNACCLEGMRLHPSIGLTLPRHVPAEGCTIAGHWFPGGTRVGINAAVLHRDKDVFGLDADDFNPERWFRNDAHRMKQFMFQVSFPR